MVELISQKEEHILNVAMQVFLEKGLHGAKMHEIADRAGVNKAMLHYYFRSKERLYSLIFEKLLVEFMNSLSDSFQPEQDFTATLKHYINHILDRLHQNPKLPLFIARELSWGGPIVQKILRELIENKALKTPQIIIEEIKKAQARGEIESGEDPIQFLFTLIGSCVYPFVARPIVEPIFPGLVNDWDSLIEQRKEAVFRVLYYGIKKRGETK